MRSMLFVPADDARKLDRGRASAADALILDLEDAVAPERKADARRQARDFLDGSRPQRAFVRINGLDDPAAIDDLAAIVGGAPDGIMLPKCTGPQDLRDLDRMLLALEVREGLPRESIRILPIAIELARSLFAAGAYRDVTPRLCGLMWGVEDLAVDLASGVATADGAYQPAVELGRSICLYAAAAAGVPAVDAAFADFRDLARLALNARAAEAAGFSTKVAIHPAQIEPINEAFTPRPETLARARRIVEAFAGADGRGAVGIDGKMHDRPHLRAAELVLARAAAGRAP